MKTSTLVNLLLSTAYEFDALDPNTQGIEQSKTWNKWYCKSETELSKAYDELLWQVVCLSSNYSYHYDVIALLFCAEFAKSKVDMRHLHKPESKRCPHCGRSIHNNSI